MSWEITDHACRHCFGRILRCSDDDRYRCSECGAEAFGTHEALCWCGVEVGGERTFECLRNPAKSEQVPQEIIVREVG